MSTEKFKEILSAGAAIAGKVWDEMERPGIQGSAELAQALFSGTGTAFVPYGDGQRDVAPAQQEVAEPQHGLPAEAVKAPELQPEMERGGRE